MRAPAPEGSRVPDFHRRRISPRRVHERLQRFGGRSRRRRSHRARLENRRQRRRRARGSEEPAARSGDREDPPEEAAHRTRGRFPQAAQPRRYQNDFADAQPVPGDRVQERAERSGLRQLLGISVGHRAHLQGRDSGHGARRRPIHPDRRAALQLLHRSQVAALRPGTDGRRSGTGAGRSHPRGQRVH